MTIFQSTTIRADTVGSLLRPAGLHSARRARLISYAGHLLSAKRLLSLNLSLEVARAQFYDVFRMFEANKLRELHNTRRRCIDGSWPVHSWGIQNGCTFKRSCSGER